MNAKARHHRVALIGAGGLGTALCWYLAQAKLSNIELLIFDPDSIELSNLNRQFLFTAADLQQAKAPLLALRLKSLFPDSGIEWQPQQTRISESNADEFLSDSSLIVDASDSPATKFFLNTYARQKEIALAHAGVAGNRAQLLFIPPTTGAACLACVFGQDQDSAEEENCQESGVLGAFVQSVACLQAQLVERYLRNISPPSSSRLYSITQNPLRVSSVEISPAPECPLCTKQVKRLDLSHKRCPETFLFTKLAIENAANMALEIKFNDEETLKQVANSLAQEDIPSITLIEQESFCLHIPAQEQQK